MAKATEKAASVTTLVIGTIEVPVALFTTVAKPAAIKDLFTTAGPNGGVLKAREVARPVPVEELPTDEVAEPVHSDPLMVDESAAWEQAAAQRIADASDQQAASREALAAWAEGDARSRGLAIGVDHPSDLAAVTLDEILPPPSGGVDGEYGRELYEEGTGEVVPPENVRRGVRLPDGKFIDCTERLAKIDEDTRLDRMEVVRFVDITQIPRARVKAIYYIGAGDPKAPHALRLMFEGLKRSRRGAVVKLTKRSRQSLGVVGWLGECLALYELVWSEDFREPPPRALVIGQAQVSEGELTAFLQLVDAWAGPVTVLDSLRDDAIGLREELHARALAGEIVPDLVDAEVIEEGDELAAQLAASLAAVGA